jgi:hypothetical protein
MNKKQQLATGLLALVIVCSVAFMPVSAGDKDSSVVVRGTAASANAMNTAELPQEQVRDLTYN